MIGILTILALSCLAGAITVGPLDVRARTRQGKPGQWSERGGTEEYFTGLNQSPQAVKVMTSTVSDPGDGIDIVQVIEGVTVTVNTGTGLAVAAIGALIAAAINAEPLIRGRVVATFATTTLTLTGLQPGYDFTWTESDASLTTPAVVTAAASAAAIPFGRGVISQGFQTGEGERLVALAASSLMTAQVHTASYTFVNTTIVEAAVYEIRGDEKIKLASAVFPSATDVATSLAGLLAALNLALPANTVDVTGGVTNLVFTAEKAGLEFKVEFSHNATGVAPIFTQTDTTGPNNSTSINRALAGFSLYSHVDPAPSGSDVGEYAGNAGVLVARKGKMWVESDEAILDDDTAFIEMGVAADNGQLFRVTSATRLGLARARVRFERDGHTAADSVAVVRLAI